MNYILNGEKNSFGGEFVDLHGPCAPSMAWRVVDAQHAYDHAVKLGATPYEGEGKCIDAPAILGIGGSLLYFIDTYGEKGSAYDADYNWLAEAIRVLKVLVFTIWTT